MSGITHAEPPSLYADSRPVLGWHRRSEPANPCCRCTDMRAAGSAWLHSLRPPVPGVGYGLAVGLGR